MKLKKLFATAMAGILTLSGVFTIFPSAVNAQDTEELSDQRVFVHKFTGTSAVDAYSLLTADTIKDRRQMLLKQSISPF